LVVPSIFLRICIASKKIIIFIQQNAQAYFKGEVTICAQGHFKLVLSIIEIELPIYLRVANKRKKLLDVITFRCLRKIKGQSISVQISGIYCMIKHWQQPKLWKSGSQNHKCKVVFKFFWGVLGVMRKL
jgi:hypothetical protein